MQYCVDVNSDEPILLINKHIGYDETDGQGIDGSLFQRELLELDAMGKKRIQVWINSPGGIVMDGMNIYNAILKTKTKVDTYNVGIAASIAAVIFQAGRNRIMADYSKLMYHNAHGGNSKELGVLNDSIATMIAGRAGKEKDEVLKIMDRTTWISAGEAFATGFCDTIEVSSEQNKKRMVATEPRAMWKEGSEVLNSLLSNQNKKQMFSKVTNKLGLVESANEDNILEAIIKIENKAAEAEDKLTKIEDALNAKKAECEKMEAELAEAKASLNSAAEAKNKAELEAKETKAKNMVEGYAKAGRIKNDAETIAKWSNKAVTDFDGTEELIKDLPVFKAANKINDVSNLSADAELTGVIAKAMRDVRNSYDKQ
jgi:ATP-dependent Clp endopeptidase proteolytic subunit ClpP